jgi:hypothetical protein
MGRGCAWVVEQAVEGNGPKQRPVVNKYVRENRLHVRARKTSHGMTKVKVKVKAIPLQAWTNQRVPGG